MPALALICLQFDLSQFMLSWHFSSIVDLRGAGPVSSPMPSEGHVNRTSSAAHFQVGNLTDLIVMPPHLDSLWGHGFQKAMLNPIGQAFPSNTETQFVSKLKLKYSLAAITRTADSVP